MADRFRLAYARWWLPQVIDGNEVLRSFQRFRHEDAIDDFRRLDDQARDTAPARVLEAVAHGLPTPEKTPRRSELGLLRHQAGLKRPSKSIREVIGGMPESFPKLAPCVLMSPLSIAQYLPPRQPPFDVVIFDEASQITTWDAVGAIARGRQTIIVGDPKQLPPTNFFGRADDDAEDETLEDHERDLESILDEAKASGLPTLQLNWHYRSRHESLIAFSNHHYYGDELVTFPAAESQDRGVHFRHLPDSTYDRGKSRTNPGEARAIVDECVARMRRDLNQPEEERSTFGVVTFNMQQQSLIQDLFDEAQRDYPEIDWYFADDRIEPTVVKNLENVQGDERDVIFFSITFGPDESGRVPLTFGALNRQGGERRLNVAVTRARQELVVYSSFQGEQLNAERSNAVGVRHLKAFLEYAEKGPASLPTAADASPAAAPATPDSPFERAVARTLADRGWEVVPRVGVSGFRVDLGIVHPDCPERFLAGIECDGESYRRVTVARDRDKTRPLVLTGLGWRIARAWAPDWWYDPESATDALLRQLDEWLTQDRERKSKSRPADTAPEADPASHPETSTPAGGAEPDRVRESSAGDYEVLFRRVRVAAPQDAGERFFASDYSATLRALAMEMIDREGAIREDILVRRIARAHGFGRTGANIRSRIQEVLENVTATDESVGRFLWSVDQAPEVIGFREGTPEAERRPLDEIPLAELRGLVRDHPQLLADEDPVAAIARRVGVGRVTRAARERIEEALRDEPPGVTRT